MATQRELDLHFAAGYFEARGYFKVTLVGGRCGGPRARVGCAVHHTDATWFGERWGGTFQMFHKAPVQHKKVDGLSRYAGYWCTWMLNLDEARKFLSDLEPYLRRKKDTAHKMIEFYDTLSNMPTKMTQNEVKELQQLLNGVTVERERMNQ